MDLKSDPVIPVAPREDVIAIADAIQAYGRKASSGEPLFFDRRNIEDVIAKSLAAALVPCAASPADQWQPIATAPKDGRTIFVGTVAWLAASNHVEHGRWFTWHPPLFGHRSHGDGGAAESPTHWMPLPTPPRATGEGVRDSVPIPIAEANARLRGEATVRVEE